MFNNASSTPVWHYRTDAPTNSVAISPEGYDLVAGTIDDYVYVFNKNGSTPLWSYLAVDEIRSVDITNDYVYLGASDGKLYNFDNPINKPDLYCASLSFSNDNPEIGDVVIINATIKVLGVNVTDNFSVGFYLDAIPSENGTEIGFQVVNGIEIGYPYFVSINWTAINGTHTIYAVVDSTDVIDESEEKNEISRVITVGSVEPEPDETPDTTEETTTGQDESSVTEDEPDYTTTIIGAAVLVALSILGAAVILRR